jgi:hypothetical protein
MRQHVDVLKHCILPLPAVLRATVTVCQTRMRLPGQCVVWKTTCRVHNGKPTNASNTYMSMCLKYQGGNQPLTRDPALACCVCLHNRAALCAQQCIDQQQCRTFHENVPLHATSVEPSAVSVVIQVQPVLTRLCTCQWCRVSSVCRFDSR